MEDERELSGKIIAAAIEVHREIGPGLLESAYEECLSRELAERGIHFERQRELPVVYKGQAVACAYRVDLIVEGEVIVELKSVESILAVHEAQLLTYLRMSGLKLGLLINFNVPVLRDGLRRLVK
jgi:GxxExxY protein